MFYDKITQIFDSKIARSVFFIIFTGGLLLFSSIVFANLCNITFLERFHLPCLNYLESAGIMAFVYIIGFGVKYGFSNKTLTNSLMTKFQTYDNKTKSEKILNNISKMSPEERAILKEQLANCCGKNTNINQQNIPVNLTHK